MGGGCASESPVFGERARVEQDPATVVRNVVLRPLRDRPPKRVAWFVLGRQFDDDGMGTNAARRRGQKGAWGSCLDAASRGYCDAGQ